MDLMWSLFIGLSHLLDLAVLEPVRRHDDAEAQAQQRLPAMPRQAISMGRSQRLCGCVVGDTWWGWGCRWRAVWPL